MCYNQREAATKGRKTALKRLPIPTEKEGFPV